MRLLICSFIVSTTFSFLGAQTVPTSPRPSFNATAHEETVDGMNSSWVDLKTNGVHLRTFLPSRWVFDGGNGPDVSFLFRDRLLADIKLELIYFEPGTWIGDFSSESIEAYFNALPTFFPDATIRIKNGSSMKPAAGSPPFLSGNYRVLRYDVEYEGRPDRDLSVWSALTFTDNEGLLILRLSGPTDRIRYSREDFADLHVQFIEILDG